MGVSRHCTTRVALLVEGLSECPRGERSPQILEHPCTTRATGRGRLEPSQQLLSEALFCRDVLVRMLCKHILVAQSVKDLPANAGEGRDKGSIPEAGRSSGEGNGNPL